MASSSGARRVLVTGADGQLGWELTRQFADWGDVIATDRRALDTSDLAAIERCCREVRPALILNAAAYTAVDRAESEPALAMRINGEAAGVLAEEANRLGAMLVHYSTDYVFDGAGTLPYCEDDSTAPQNEYGRSKLVGERAVATMAKQFLIFRTSWLYGNRRQNFFLTMLRLARERDELRVVSDQIGSPTWVHCVAQITRQVFSGPAASIASGLYHLSANGATSWHGFAKAILDAVGDEARRAKRVVPITTEDFPTAAKRPAYSVLSCAKLEAAMGVRIPDWHEQLAACAAERASNRDRLEPRS
jgi:dTDP-4-dehydrorhamnose reductase